MLKFLIGSLLSLNVIQAPSLPESYLSTELQSYQFDSQNTNLALYEPISLNGTEHAPDWTVRESMAIGQSYDSIHDLDPFEAEAIMNQTARAEIVMAHSLIEIMSENKRFNKTATDFAQTLASEIHEMLTNVGLTNNPEALHNFIKNSGGKFLGVWKDRNFSEEDLKEMASDGFRDQWTISFIGDLMRHHGEMIEGLNNNPSLREQINIDVTSSNSSSFNIDEYLDDLEDLRESFRDTDAFSKEHRVRDSRSPKNPYEIPAYLQGLVEGPITGMTLKKVGKDSALGQIEKAFGLPTGADISGTTADSLATVYTIVERMKSEGTITPKEADEMLPAMVLMAPLKMVSEYHHTLLEVMTPLVLNQALQRYNAIHPTSIISECVQTDSPQVRELYDDMENILIQADRATTKIFNFYNDLNTKSTYLMSDLELDKVQKLSEISAESLALWRTYKNNHDGLKDFLGPKQ